MKKNHLILIIFFTTCSYIAFANNNENPNDDKNFDCNKKTCSQIESCEEAIFKLNQCGMKKLDRDNDGIPCESICG
ncbi:excalibur calcium-binding domain-containing protein [Thorsellia anophelis]|uniref:Excalibur calcium-binding domain-containing protein n=1 Tax=Thorsellia anophelis DSM 18579 TaxID=1123402 RepID=A0A1I0F2Z8_9GAMM|nr:excalibur calcium-binding domain-containing protein [Thorsellia anophelis]SET52377.1 Excalibur calcium-binding domain-containing protein [Thorsellia anophelis DSM 18579]